MDGTEQKKAVMEIMESCGIPVCGFAPFEAIKNDLLPCSKARLLPPAARMVICGLFPYYSGERPGNLSKYAVPEDYHRSVMEKLAHASELLKSRFPGFEFVPFCDASPVPEVRTAALAGLGRVGRNGLLIHDRFGSFVFIGEIVTDFPAESRAQSIRSCIGCGQCLKNCPSGALSPNGLQKGRCLSAITQKKGALTPAEQEMVAKCGSIWGCDICQDVCPHNKDIQKTMLPEFTRNLKPALTRRELEDEKFEKLNSRRAFLWRGTEVLRRNLRLTSETPREKK